jgi:tryptophan-rich sensory protein
MTQLASRAQLRGGFWKVALVTVPVVVLLGSAAGRLANSGYDNRWFAALEKPASMPPSWAFGAVWATLYVLLGFALALVIDARGARSRGVAVTLFVVQFVLNLAWSPLFFALHQVTAAFWLIVAMFLAALATCFAFANVRPLAGWLMVPYLAWLCFAAALNWDYDRLNPDAETLVPDARTTQIAA